MRRKASREERIVATGVHGAPGSALRTLPGPARACAAMPPADTDDTAGGGTGGFPYFAITRPVANLKKDEYAAALRQVLRSTVWLFTSRQPSTAFVMAFGVSV